MSLRKAGGARCPAYGKRERYGIKGWWAVPTLQDWFQMKEGIGAGNNSLRRVVHAIR